MKKIDALLRGVRPREPSPRFVAKGLARIEAGAASRDPGDSRPWRFAAIGAAILLAASAALNVVLWQRIDAARATVESGAASVGYGQRSVFRAEGGLFVRDTRYGLDRSRDGDDG